MASDFEKWLFGDQDKKDQLQSEINDAQTRLSQITNSRERQALIDQIKQLKGELQAEMQKQGAVDSNGVLKDPTSQDYAQGVTDQSGRMLSAKDNQNQFVDQDYINMIKQQNDQNANITAASAEREKRRMSLQGNNYNPVQVTASLEGGLRNTQASTMGAIKGELDSAYGKSAQDLSNRTGYANTLYTRDLTNLNRKQAYATQLSDMDRQSLMAQLQSQLQEDSMKYNMNAQQLASLQQQLANQPDGALQTLAGLVAEGGAGAIVRYLTSRTTGGAVPKAVHVLGL